MPFQPRVERDAVTGDTYIYLGAPHPGVVHQSIELEQRDRRDPGGLDRLVLDFDRQGRLVGIEVLGDVEKVLRPELLADAKRI